jgi:hypothetical protein
MKIEQIKQKIMNGYTIGQWGKARQDLIIEKYGREMEKEIYVLEKNNR